MDRNLTVITIMFLLICCQEVRKDRIFNNKTQNYKTCSSCKQLIDSLKAVNQNMPRFRLSDFETFYKKYQSKNLVDYFRPRINTEVRYESQILAPVILSEDDSLSLLSRRNNWSKSYSDSVFLNYIAPPIDQNEYYEPWRKVYMDYFTNVVDSVNTTNDPVVICNTINDHLKEKFTFTEALEGLPFKFTALDLLEISQGVCRDQVAFATFAMRSMGLPVAHEFIPNWGERNMGHDFNALLDTSGSWRPFDGASSNIGSFDLLNKPTKVYRYHYSEQEMMVHPETFRDDIPGLFQNRYISDVSHLYLPSNSISFDIDSPPIVETKNIYLSVWNNQYWTPVASSTYENGKAQFNNIGQEVVFLPVWWVAGQPVPAGRPFYVDTLDQIHTIEHTTHPISVKVTRKYPMMIQWLDILKEHLVGAEFQGSNDSTFLNYQVLHKVKEVNNLNNHIVKISHTSKYKYFRFVFPDIAETLTWPHTPEENFGNVAEIGFYSQNEQDSLVKLRGKLFSEDYVNLRKLSRIMDNNYNTYQIVFTNERDYPGLPDKVFGIPKGETLWLGMALDSLTAVDAISYCPRSDTNEIFVNSKYELYYWNNKWISLGKKVAKGSMIEFENCPKGGLFLLKNVTDGGTENRIFTYNNGEQVWW